MGEETVVSLFKEEFIGRVKEARLKAGYSQTDLAAILGISQDKYKHYESRSLLPHELIERFCLATRTSVFWLFTGKAHRGP